MELSSKSPIDVILAQFANCPDNGIVNMTTEDGYIYLVGGILNKIKGDRHYMAIDGKWVLITENLIKNANVDLT